MRVFSLNFDLNNELQRTLLNIRDNFYYGKTSVA